MGTVANSTRSARKKVPGRPFQKGQSGNPSGRPKQLEELKVQCRAMTPTILKCLSEEIEDEDGKKGEYWFEASKLVLSYGWGRPASAEEDRDAMAQASRPLASISAEKLLSIIDAVDEDDEPSEG